jgi:hypothetical protein
VVENYLIPYPLAIKKPTISGRVNISTVHLDFLGTIHNSTCIAETWGLDIKKAGPFLTLPNIIRC